MSTSARSRALAAILCGGIVAGVLDLAYAFISAGTRGRSPVRVLHAIASGWLGSEAFKGGTPAAALGAVSHFVIAIGAAAVYYAASRRLAILRDHFVVSGLIFGFLVYLFTNFVVLFLSAVPFQLRYPPRALLEGFLAIGLLVGLPISLSVRLFADSNREKHRAVFNVSQTGGGS